MPESIIIVSPVMNFAPSNSHTTDSAKALFEEHLPRECVTVRSYGNVLAATAFLHGLSVEELSPNEIDHHDPDYQIIVTVRAQKPG